VRWRDISHAYATFALVMGTGAGSLAGWDRGLQAGGFSREETAGVAKLEWRAPAGRLGLSGSVRVTAVEDQDRAFSDRFNGRAIPLIRLSDRRLL
jgi:hypothetical protein